MYDHFGVVSKMYFSPESYLCRNLLARSTMNYRLSTPSDYTRNTSSIGGVKTVKAQKASPHPFSVITL